MLTANDIVQTYQGSTTLGWYQLVLDYMSSCRYFGRIDDLAKNHLSIHVADSTCKVI
ncbi:hypothetical protein VIBNISOn1_800021 [Vibrio nigripulchritudo SOn1]|uniref:Uncharacterized protein n=1 Tax=Vibrio nigripulchritudo SOn1 TaxID=1238450 RepID=A0AAV2VXA8_9VIBR|nr:hypothetical protein VIBNISOn1_800021 [Vibrio nigripulchritudo SOn1]